MGGYGSYASASRPQLGQAGTPNWVAALGATGGAMTGLGALGAMI